MTSLGKGLLLSNWSFSLLDPDLHCTVPTCNKWLASFLQREDIEQ